MIYLAFKVRFMV